jgi:ribonucleoside-diphosphate reductase alpha chain
MSAAQSDAMAKRKTGRVSSATFPPSPIAHEIWDLKYRLRDETGAPLEDSPAETYRRVAAAVAAVEPGERREHWMRAFRDALDAGSFLPAGRILAGSGTGRKVTLFNCFVMGTIPDDLGGIFEQLREAALTMQQGGGIGHDFSTLRPKGAAVASIGAAASGPISFMDVWDAMCRTIMSAGSRRGAMMGTLRCDHPDIEDFVAAKADPDRLRMFNMSVLVTDAFMDAVARDEDWDLVFGGRLVRRVRARALWDKIMRATYDYAEPGVIFIDRVNAENNLAYCETIQATNPCGEQPLPPYGACLLGSINLARFVRDPFGSAAALDAARLEEVVAVAVRFLDNVIEVSNFPLEAQRREAFAKRRLGLGVTGLADALAMLGLVYGSEAAADVAGNWMRRIQNAAYRASAELAAEKGVFPLYDREEFVKSPTISRLDADVRNAIAKHGLRNSHLTSIAPTGTISLLADNVSSGIEPIFSLAYTRAVLMPDGSRREQEVTDHAVRLYRAMHGAACDLPLAFVTAQTLSPDAHLAMQAAMQPWVDSSISKTINLPRDISFEAFKDVYARAYAMGLKGCTTYRPNEVTGAVLADSTVQPGLPLPAPAMADKGAIVRLAEPLKREEILPGFTYKLRWPDSEHSFYITINDVMRDGRRRPYEIFINSRNVEHYAWTAALTLLVSAIFRRGGDVAFVVDELKGVFDPRGGHWMNGRYIPSLMAAIADIIERHMIDIGFLAPEAASEMKIVPEGAGATCPRCGHPTLHHSEGCLACLDCGYSKCA